MGKAGVAQNGRVSSSSSFLCSLAGFAAIAHFFALHVLFDHVSQWKRMLSWCFILFSVSVLHPRSSIKALGVVGVPSCDKE